MNELRKGTEKGCRANGARRRKEGMEKWSRIVVEIIFAK